jgi:uncharacterized delta-60 repeat protein
VTGTDAGLAQIAHVTTSGVVDARTPLYVPSKEYGNSSIAFAFDTSGNVVWSGPTYAASDENFALFRDRASDGQPDTTFGTGGMATIDLNNYFASHVNSYPELAAYVGSHDMTGHTIVSNDFGYQPAYDAAGRLVVAGQADVRDLYTDASGNTQSVPIQEYSLLLRFNPDGTWDTSFGLDGVSATDLRPGFDQVFQHVAFQSDGKILAAGVVNMGTDNGSGTQDDVSLARLTADAQATTSVAPASVSTTTMAAAATGPIVAAPADEIAVLLARPSRRMGPGRGPVGWDADEGMVLPPGT